MRPRRKAVAPRVPQLHASGLGTRSGPLFRMEAPPNPAPRRPRRSGSRSTPSGKLLPNLRRNARRRNVRWASRSFSTDSAILKRRRSPRLRNAGKSFRQPARTREQVHDRYDSLHGSHPNCDCRRKMCSPLAVITRIGRSGREVPTATSRPVLHAAARIGARGAPAMRARSVVTLDHAQRLARNSSVEAFIRSR